MLFFMFYFYLDIFKIRRVVMSKTMNLLLLAISSILLVNVSYSQINGKILYTSNRSGNYNLWICNSDGTNHVELTNKSGDELNPRVSPDGSKIVYTYKPNSEDGYLWVMNIDGTGDHQLVSERSNYGVWAPDGSKIIYHKVVGSWSDWNGPLHIVNTDGTGDQVLLNSTSPYTGLYPSDWKNGKIAYRASYSHSGNNRMFIMDEDGTDSEQLVSHHSEFGRFSLDGTAIIYGSSGDIRIVNTDGTNDRLIHANSTRAQFALSPDGSKIAFIDNSDIYTIDFDGSDEMQLTTLGDIQHIHILVVRGYACT